MQYTSKLAILAVALFSTSVLAAPAPFDGDYEVEAREVDNELSAREFYDAYLEARADPDLDARDLDAMDLEAREYLEYLEAREAATAQTGHSVPSTPSTPSGPQTPMSATHPKKYVHAEKLRQHKAAALEYLDTNKKAYRKALRNSDNKYHRIAVQKYFRNRAHLKAALADEKNPLHRAALRRVHTLKANKYLSDKKQFKKALRSKRNPFHKEAVRKYLSSDQHFEHALTSKRAKFHRQAVRKYLSDGQVRKAAIADKHNKYHKAAVKLQKKLNQQHVAHHTTSSSAATPTATHT